MKRAQNKRIRPEIREQFEKIARMVTDQTGAIECTEKQYIEGLSIISRVIESLTDSAEDTLSEIEMDVPVRRGQRTF